MALFIPFIVDAATTTAMERVLTLAGDLVRGERRALAAAITDARGSATDADRQAVLSELERLPSAVLRQLQSAGTRVVVCRGSVTEYMTSWRGQAPRGWPAGKTWDSVPGAFARERNEVVIATHARPDGARIVPLSGDGHGSINMLVHETLHGYDGSTKVSVSAPFLAARRADAAHLTAYEGQSGLAGDEETFAEAGARFFSGDPLSDLPHLRQYFLTTLGASV